MSSLDKHNPTQFTTTQLINNHITVQVAAEITGYNVQYLRRLLRAQRMEAIKIGQIWLVDLVSLQEYFGSALRSNDMRFGPKRSWQPPF